MLATRADRGGQAMDPRRRQDPHGRSARLLDRLEQRRILVFTHAVGVAHDDDAALGFERLVGQLAQQLAGQR